MNGLRRSWVEIDTEALRHNLGCLRAVAGPGVLIAPVVKSNAYGHGASLAARAFVDGGADWLCVDSLHEASAVRRAGFDVPIWILGWVPPSHADALVDARASVVVYDRAQVDAFAAAARAHSTVARVHIKVETGTHRQGLGLAEAEALARHAQHLEGIDIVGLSSHFANVEDTTDHTFARAQLDAFRHAVDTVRAIGLELPLNSIANSAATLVFEDSIGDIVRPGIAAYGMWPSRETFLSAKVVGHEDTQLRPALTWKTRIAQVKPVPAGGHVGYGCTFKTSHDSRVAVLPVGYYDGYDRGVSNLAHVLVRGARAPLRGRVCMNMIMVDVTHVPGAATGDEVVLIGSQGGETISPEQFADWAGTINYEITTRILESIPRVTL